MIRSVALTRGMVRIGSTLGCGSPRGIQSAWSGVQRRTHSSGRSFTYLPLIGRQFQALARADTQMYVSASRFSTSTSRHNGDSGEEGSPNLSPDNITMDEYHRIADETLESILMHCEDLADLKPQVDVELAQGVLTLELPPNGIYVINKQPPNKQIWLSSPISGPKRYDLIEGYWTNHRDGETLGNLLRHEVSEALGVEATFDNVDDYSIARK
ncbi:Frataxin, mitochondrial [Limtongia smithiae]|uniref:Frataxin, mitochondrial n=1 Tax=Limtongia smithiae TaxID=1125753 RepID=UPI0034CD5717